MEQTPPETGPSAVRALLPLILLTALGLGACGDEPAPSRPVAAARRVVAAEPAPAPIDEAPDETAPAEAPPAETPPDETPPDETARESVLPDPPEALPDPAPAEPIEEVIGSAGPVAVLPARLAADEARDEPVDELPDEPQDDLADEPADDDMPAAVAEPPAVEVAPPPAVADPDPPADDVPPPVADLLDRLERSAGDLEAFTAKVRYTKESFLLDRAETRRGEIVYQVDRARDRKRFAVLFDSLVVGQRLERGRLRHYVFDGRWLAEIDHESRQFIKREIVPPGKTLDPLKLGEGPIPLPIGQPRREVVARFEVELLDAPPPDGPLGALDDVEGLVLVPRPDRPEAEEYERVEIFYDRATLLPAGIVAVEVNGDRKIVRLDALERNPALDAAALAKLDIDEPDPRQWRIDVRPWRDPDEGG
jgi:hypothetical protein